MKRNPASTTRDGHAFIKITTWKRDYSRVSSPDVSPDGIYYFASRCLCPFCGKKALKVHAIPDPNKTYDALMIRHWYCDACIASGEDIIATMGEGDAEWEVEGIFPEAFLTKLACF